MIKHVKTIEDIKKVKEGRKERVKEGRERGNRLKE